MYNEKNQVTQVLPYQETHNLSGHADPIDMPSANMGVGALPTKKGNALIESANPILVLVSQIRKSKQHPDPERLQRQLIQEIKAFSQRLDDARYSEKMTIAANYCLCVVVDEAVLRAPWGASSIWSKQSLLNTFHQENWGGERFYVILKNALKQLPDMYDLVEFLYLCLSLGYEGMYFEKDKLIREDVRSKVYYRIRSIHHQSSKQLSPHWQDNQPLRAVRTKRISLKRRLIIFTLSFLVLGFAFNYSLQRKSVSVQNSLNDIATQPAVTLFSQLLGGSINQDRDSKDVLK